MIIYKVENKINGKVYIGKTVLNIEKRKIKHLNDAKNRNTNMRFHIALRKYGADNFEWTVIREANSKEELNQLEKEYIKYYKENYEVYNVSLGGDGAALENLSDEHKRKISESHKGKKMSDDARRNMSNAQKGKTRTEEFKNKMRSLMIGNDHALGYSHTEKAKINISKSLIGNKRTLGFKHSNETKDKMSKSQTGRKHSKESINKMSESKKGHIVSDETRRKISESLRKRSCKK
jgi:group I intron endonuclease